MQNQDIKLTVEMIQNGEHRELYEKYAKQKSHDYYDNLIKYELASYGYCHDILCNNPQTTVRKHVISSDIRYAPQCFDGTRILWEHIAGELVDNRLSKTLEILSVYEWFINLDLEQLNITLNNLNKTKYKTIKLLYQAEKMVPTTIEKNNDLESTLFKRFAAMDQRCCLAIFGCHRQHNKIQGRNRKIHRFDARWLN